MRWIKKEYFHLLLVFLSALVLLFIIAPLLGMILKTSGSEMLNLTTDEEALSGIRRTLYISVLATFGFSIFSVPLAYLLARNNFLLKKFLLGIINLPVVIPHTAAGIALLTVISGDGLLGVQIVNRPIGIGLAMAFVSLPFLINAAYDGFCSVPVEMEQAASSLGASPLKVFVSIAVPLASRSIFTGMVMMFSRGLSEFGAVIIIAYHPMVTPVMIWERFTSFGLSYARPLAVLFILICLLIFILARLLYKEK